MHIVIIDTTLTTPPFGGSHTFLVVLTTQFVNHGWRVTLITQGGKDYSLLTALRDSGVRVVDNLWRTWHLPEERASRLARWVSKERPDRYVLSNSTETGWLALPLLPSDLPVATIAHNDVSAYYDPLRHYLPFVDVAIGVSNEVCRKLTTEAGVPEQRVRQIAYGVKTLTEQEADKRLSANEASPWLRLGYFGRIVQQQKRVFEMVELSRELDRLGVAFRLDIVGDGPDRKALEAKFAQEGMTDCVRFWGWQSGDHLSARYASCNVFILMSDHEGLPVALLEAMGQALAPVVSRTASGNAEVVHDGVNGFVVPVGDVSGFAARLADLATDPVKLAEFRKASWKISHSYTVSKMADAYISCLNTMSISSVRPAEPYPPMPSCRSRYPHWARKIKAWLLSSH